MIIYETFYPCGQYVYTVSRDSQQVSGIRKIPAGMEKKCPEFTKEIKLRLTNGFEISQEMEKEAGPVAASMAALMYILFWAGLRIRRIIKSQPAAYIGISPPVGSW